jgi:hypothetical protein
MAASVSTRCFLEQRFCNAHALRRSISGSPARHAPAFLHVDMDAARQGVFALLAKWARSFDERDYAARYWMQVDRWN